MQLLIFRSCLHTHTHSHTLTVLSPCRGALFSWPIRKTQEAKSSNTPHNSHKQKWLRNQPHLTFEKSKGWKRKQKAHKEWKPTGWRIMQDYTSGELLIITYQNDVTDCQIVWCMILMYNCFMYSGVKWILHGVPHKCKSPTKDLRSNFWYTANFTNNCFTFQDNK